MAPPATPLDALAQVLRRWRGTARPGDTIDGLLAAARTGEPFEERERWLAAVLSWLSRPGRIDDDTVTKSRPPQVTRLVHLLNVLDRNPEWKDRVARTLRATLSDTDALAFYCETGLPRERAFLSEAVGRLLGRLLPADPGQRDIGRLLVSVFPNEAAVGWMEQIDDVTLARVGELLSHAAKPGEEVNPLRRDMPDALVYLVSEIASVGLSSSFRHRAGTPSFRESPFYGLAGAAEEVARAVRAGDRDGLADATARLGGRLAGCRRAMDACRAHLDQHGVSTRVVYELERMEAQIRRTEALLGRLNDAGDRTATAAALARLVREAIESTRVRDLVGRNSRVLARKVVDRSAETGAHYIARNRREYLEMLRSAAGGGLVTVITTWVKLGVSLLKAPPFVEGALASLNYSASFVAIQLAHFTLATKQPAMTGPALARRLEHAHEPGGVAAFVDEAFRLLRSQAASILGNVATVVPGVMAVDLAARAALGHPLLPAAKAEATIASLSLLGPTPVYAALTGLLLYLSSLAAGWADNWFVLRGLEGAVAAQPRLARFLGRSRASRLAHWLRENVSGLAGNVSLGALLGMTPAVGRFLGLPLDVRHVTLSAGFLAASAAGLGARHVLSPEFAWAVGGVASMAVLNVGVSFALAAGTAVRAKGLRAPERSALQHAFWSRVWLRPADLVVPEPPPPGPA